MAGLDFPLIVVAHHEAAHSVVRYRVEGSAEPISIVREMTTDGESLGRVEDNGGSDSFDEAYVASTVLSCYAGGHAQRRCDRRHGDDGCGQDEQIAAAILREWGWEDREQEFRDRSLALVEKHWPEIEAVAAELHRTLTLDEDEVALIADAAAGIAEFTYGGDLDLELRMYRAMRPHAEKGGA